MAIGYGEGSIAGVALVFNGVPIQAMLVGGSGLKTSIITNTQRGINGKPSTQVFELDEFAGAEFSLVFPQMPRAVYDAVIAAVETALSSPSDFVVIYDDGVNTYNVKATTANGRNEDGRGWVTTEEPVRLHQQYAKGVTMRFIAKESNS